MQKRGKQVPGGACGFWGACGVGVSTGMYISIALKATPLAKEAWGLSNQMTATALDAIGKNGGPRCCKPFIFLHISDIRFHLDDVPDIYEEKALLYHCIITFPYECNFCRYWRF